MSGGCKGKRKYGDYADALAALPVITDGLLSGAVVQTVYVCPTCDALHLTSRPRMRRPGRGRGKADTRR